MSAPSPLLLDTCALIWLVNGGLSQKATAAVTMAIIAGGVYVSPVSAWEVGMLSSPRGNRPALSFLPDAKAWFARVMARTGVLEAALTSDIAVDASCMPGGMHGDPADRLLVATARSLNIPILTGDAKIIAYAGPGRVSVVQC